FSDHAADAQQVRTRLSQQLAILEDGGWVGEGAKRFSAEMRELILPALDALARALDGANGAILRATEMMREAETEAAALFRAVDNAMQASGGGSGADGGSPASIQRAQQIATLASGGAEQTPRPTELRR